MESITPAAVLVASVNAPLAVSTRSPSEGAPCAGASTVDGTGRSSSVEDAPVVRRNVPPVELDGGSDEEDDVEEHRSDEDQAAANSAEVEAAAHAIEYIADANERSKMKLEWRSSKMKEVVSELPFGCKDPHASAETSREGGKKSKWTHSHRVYNNFANFLGNAVILPAAKVAQNNDVDVDAGVFKLLRCMTTATPHYIRAFLDSRRLGHAVAGGSRPIKMSTVRNDMKPLGFLFAHVTLPAAEGAALVSPDCRSRGKPFCTKMGVETQFEQSVGADTGTHGGNTMKHQVVKNFKRDEQRNARAAGETRDTNAPMTVAIMRGLYDNLITKHLDIGELDDISETSITDAKHDFQAYSVYAFSFMTLARPKSTLSLMHKDIKLPINRRARNVEFVEE